MSEAQKVEPFAHLEIAPVLRKQRLFEAGQMKLLIATEILIRQMLLAYAPSRVIEK
jgi:hypothetical protein